MVIIFKSDEPVNQSSNTWLFRVTILMRPKPLSWEGGKERFLKIVIKKAMEISYL